MNERIAKLYDQATILEGNGDYVAGELNPVKFAELLIKECDRYVAEHYDECEPWMEPGDLLKHFGIE